MAELSSKLHLTPEIASVETALASKTLALVDDSAGFLQDTKRSEEMAAVIIMLFFIIMSSVVGCVVG